MLRSTENKLQFLLPDNLFDGMPVLPNGTYLDLKAPGRQILQNLSTDTSSSSI